MFGDNALNGQNEKHRPFDTRKELNDWWYDRQWPKDRGVELNASGRILGAFFTYGERDRPAFPCAECGHPNPVQVACLKCAAVHVFKIKGEGKRSVNACPGIAFMDRVIDTQDYGAMTEGDIESLQQGEADSERKSYLGVFHVRALS